MKVRSPRSDAGFQYSVLYTSLDMSCLPDLLGMEGVTIAARADASGGASASGSHRGDRVSELPDDLLYVILRELPAAEAARTSVLSRRWRSVWFHLPDLSFVSTRDKPGPGFLRFVSRALDGHAAQHLTSLNISTSYAGLGDAGVNGAAHVRQWLRHAASRVAGEFDLAVFRFKESWPGESIDLPVFARAKTLSVDLPQCAVRLPPAAGGVFGSLTKMSLQGVRFACGEDGGLAELVTTRCPRLRELEVNCDIGLVSLVLRAPALERLEVSAYTEFRRLELDAAKLRVLSISSWCEDMVVKVSAPRLEELEWGGHVPDSFQLGETRWLRRLRAPMILSHGYYLQPKSNLECLKLLRRFPSVDHLELYIRMEFTFHPPDHPLYFKDWIGYITQLPIARAVTLNMLHRQDSFADGIYLLKKCSGIKELHVVLDKNMVEKLTCNLDCICRRPLPWRSEDINLSYLQEVEIDQFLGVDYEMDFVKILLNSTEMLERMVITFAHDASCVEEICGRLLRFPRLPSIFEIYVRRDGRKLRV